MQYQKYFLEGLVPQKVYTDGLTPVEKQDIEMERRYRYDWVMTKMSDQSEYDAWCTLNKWHGVQRPGYIPGDHPKEPVKAPPPSYRDPVQEREDGLWRRLNQKFPAPRLVEGSRRGKSAVLERNRKAKEEKERQAEELLKKTPLVQEILPVLEQAPKMIQEPDLCSFQESVLRDEVHYRGKNPVPVCWYLNSLADDESYAVAPEGVVLKNTHYSVDSFEVQLTVDNDDTCPLQLSFTSSYDTEIQDVCPLEGEIRYEIVAAEARKEKIILPMEEIIQGTDYNSDLPGNYGLVYPCYFFTPRRRFRFFVWCSSFDPERPVSYSLSLQVRRRIRFVRRDSPIHLLSEIKGAEPTLDVLLFGFPFSNPMTICNDVSEGLKTFSLVDRGARQGWVLSYDTVANAHKSILFLDGYSVVVGKITYQIRPFPCPVNVPYFHSASVVLKTFAYENLDRSFVDFGSYPRSRRIKEPKSPTSFRGRGRGGGIGRGQGRVWDRLKIPKKENVSTSISWK